MTNWDIVTLVNLIRNKDLQGEDIKASEFQTLINTQSKLLFAEKTGLPNLYSLNAPIERRGVGLSRKIQTELRPFYTREILATSSATADLSTKNIGYLDAIEPNPILGRGFDELFGDEVADRLGSSVVMPTTKDPAFEWATGYTILLYPATITSVVLKYYRFPIDAVIATTVNSTTLLEEYDAANSTELEWEDEQKVEIAYRVLRDLGINMERGDIAQYAQTVVTNE